jgi:hypothetical protein
MIIFVVETARKINHEDVELIGLSMFKRLYQDSECESWKTWWYWGVLKGCIIYCSCDAACDQLDAGKAFGSEHAEGD